ncbi:MAG TPA: AAA family ATPase [Acidimicrobiales bacterium]|nr:AAA family ATPase [Acidimicrobiales bacterium]
MFLKTLTLKGFKSFADSTTLQMEPGVTVVVGPNGSGKSNVVDAIAWVLGAQGPRVVRSSKMDDVIFAGTSTRPALGRAEVSLTIDNSARRLPIDFSEVTVTRTLFRTGESEYAINGVACRLLDVQELLSDTGVGRQQHVIIGQGQLDAILSARPEERRAVIEEAAGVLKYRRRRERAERRLESSEGALARLEDLLREVRRQIRPLERQASSARRHGELSDELRRVRLFLAGREVAQLKRQLAATSDAADAASARRLSMLAEAEVLDAALAERQAELDDVHVEELDGHIARVEQLRERARGLEARCEERRRAQAELAEILGATNALERLESEESRIAAELDDAESAAAALAPEWAQLEAAEAAQHIEEQRQRAQLEALEGISGPGTLFAAAEPDAVGASAAGPSSTGGAEAVSRRAAGGAVLDLAEARRQAVAARERLAAAREAEARLAERAAAQRGQREQLIASLSELRHSLDATRQAAAAAAEASAETARREGVASSSADAADEAWREAGGAHQAAAARVEALGLALDEARARAGLEQLAESPGVLGTLPDLIEVADGAALAVEAALEAVLDAVLVRGAPAARQALEVLRGAPEGGAVLPVVGASPGTEPFGPGAAGRELAGEPPLPGTELLRPQVQSTDPGVESLLDILLERVVLCRGGFDAACDAALAAPGWTVVTLDGERFSARGWRVGAGRSGVTRAALERAVEQERTTAEAVAAAASLREERHVTLAAARRGAATAAAEASRLAAEVAQVERAEAEAAQRCEQLGGLVEQVERDAELASASLRAAGVELAAADECLVRREEEEREAARRREEVARERRVLEERARALLVLRRDLEVRAASLEERRSQLRGRGEELRREVAVQRDELLRAEHRRSLSAADGEVLSRLAAVARATLAELDSTLAELSTCRARAAASAAELLGALRGLRAERSSIEQALEELVRRTQRLEIEQAEGRVRLESALEVLSRELEVSLEDALAVEEPPCPPGTTLPDHLRWLDRELRAIGAVNPLALEELAELEERHGFLQAQLEDVRGARRELREVIRGVDAEIVSAFSDAYADVEEHFGRLVATLFPGGEGRLSLSAPDDLLSTGVEIEARPPGRNVRRLSLLSGGERSLVALAFLFAVFRSRPSPFYVMDEVEAALDEVNLRRFLGLLEEFREEAQLIVVSHQKRTMEVADALYGITMQSGGASRAVSERLRRGATPSDDPLPLTEAR